LRESFIPNCKQGRAVVLREGHDIIPGETCVPTSLNINNLGEVGVLLLGCTNLGLQMKAVELQLILLISSSHNLLSTFLPNYGKGLAIYWHTFCASYISEQPVPSYILQWVWRYHPTPDKSDL
jgi:hypothetical protein